MVQTRSASSSMTPRALPTTTSRAPRAPSFANVPSTLALGWLAVSLPLVAWDTGYVLLRPASMPGGSLHWPLWVPYELYGNVDHIYGFKQWNANNGFTAAQAALNLIESLMYLAYVYLWYTQGRPLGGKFAGRTGVTGRTAGWALLLGFSAAVMTLSKTVLYCESGLISRLPRMGVGFRVGYGIGELAG